ncbi:MAG TPA: VOC family protein [Gemmatimonadaceae bacterium]
MKGINPYLNFDGNTAEAMKFYAACLDAELHMQSFKDVGMDAPGAEDRTVHAMLQKDGAVIMASDSQPGQPVSMGDNIWLNIDCSDAGEQDRYFKALGAGGNVVMPLAEQFWGARFGMLRDKYGVGWMFNCEMKQKG